MNPIDREFAAQLPRRLIREDGAFSVELVPANPAAPRDGWYSALTGGEQGQEQAVTMPLMAFIERYEQAPAVPASTSMALLLHTGRCGSTLTSRFLGAAGLGLMIEPALINQLAHAVALDTETRSRALRAVVACFARWANAPVILKICVLEAGNCQPLFEAFADAPWWFMYVHPRRMATSFTQKPNPWFKRLADEKSRPPIGKTHEDTRYFSALAAFAYHARKILARQPRPEQLLCFDADIGKPAEQILDQMKWPRPADWPQRVQDISQEHAHRPGKGKPVVARSIDPDYAAGLPANVDATAQAAFDELQAAARLVAAAGGGL